MWMSKNEWHINAVDAPAPLMRVAHLVGFCDVRDFGDAVLFPQRTVQVEQNRIEAIQERRLEIIARQ
jgi:hypothetical protein